MIIKPSPAQLRANKFTIDCGKGITFAAQSDKGIESYPEPYEDYDEPKGL